MGKAWGSGLEMTVFFPFFIGYFLPFVNDFLFKFVSSFYIYFLDSLVSFHSQGNYR